MSVEIVVARYNEDLSWLDPISQNCVIYNKGSDNIELNKYKNVNTLRNVGRETHSYLYHIIENYEKLADVTVFIQGQIIDHVYAERLATRGPPMHPISWIRDRAAEALKTGVSINAYNHNQGINGAHYNFNQEMYGTIVKQWQDSPAVNFGIWLEYITGKPFPKEPILWYIGACFAASKQTIQSVPLSTWCKIYEQCNQHENPITGYYMERAWYHIFKTHRL